MLKIEDHETACSKAFNVVKTMDPSRISVPYNISHRCKIHCLEKAGKWSAYSYLSIHDTIQDVQTLDFKLLSIEDGCTVFEIGFPKKNCIHEFHELCSVGKLNKIAISHRIFKIEFFGIALANINYLNSQNARYLPL